MIRIPDRSRARDLLGLIAGPLAFLTSSGGLLWLLEVAYR